MSSISKLVTVIKIGVMVVVSHSVFLITIGVTFVVSLEVFRSVTGEQLRALEQCEPSCQLGSPLFHGPEEFVVPALLLGGVMLLIMSAVAGWPISSAQMRP